MNVNYDLQVLVPIPLWLLIVMLFLASGAVQYALIGLVKLVWHLTRERKAPAEKPAILLLEDYKKDSASGGSRRR